MMTITATKCGGYDLLCINLYLNPYLYLSPWPRLSISGSLGLGFESGSRIIKQLDKKTSFLRAMVGVSSRLANYSHLFLLIFSTHFFIISIKSMRILTSFQNISFLFKSASIHFGCLWEITGCNENLHSHHPTAGLPEPCVGATSSSCEALGLAQCPQSTGFHPQNCSHSRFSLMSLLLTK